jgi:hypothetical protein
MELLRYLDVKTNELANLWGLAAKQLTALGKLVFGLCKQRVSGDDVFGL